MRQFLIFLSFLMPFMLSAYDAYDFESNGIYYSILSTSDLTVEVTSVDKKYSGDLVIPESVNFNTKNFTPIMIGSRAFSGSSIKSVVIPNTVSQIKDEAFSGCTQLETVEMPTSVSKVGMYVFNGCKKLKEIPFKEGAKDMGNYTFYGCSSLTNVNIPSSITSLANGMFSGCTNIKSITFHKNLQSIGVQTFKNCPNIESITICNPYPISAEEWEQFDRSVYLNANVFVPSNSLSRYQQADVWKNFLLIAEDSKLGCASFIELAVGKNGKVEIDGITYTPSESYYGSETKTYSFAKLKGETVAVNFIPNNGYRVNKFVINGNDTEISSNSFQLNLESDYQISVEFSPCFTLNVNNEGENGVIYVNGEQIMTNEEKSFTFDDYYPVDIYLDIEEGYGSQVKCFDVNYGKFITTSSLSKIDDTHYKLSSNASDLILYFSYFLKSYTIHGSCQKSGSFSMNGHTVTSESTYVEIGCSHGDPLHVEISPNHNYAVEHFYVNGSDEVDKLDNNTYEIEKVIQNTNLSVSFVQLQPFTISCGIGGNLTIFSETISNDNKTIFYKPFTTTSFIANPDSGYEIKQLILDGILLDDYVAGATYPLNSIEGIHNILVSFEPVHPDIVILTSEVAGISSISTSVKYDTSVDIRLDIPDGWSIESASLNGLDITSSFVDGCYHTDPLTENSSFSASLNFVDFAYSEEDSTGIINVSDSELCCQVESGAVKISGLNGERVLVYSLNGMLIKEIDTSFNTLHLSLKPNEYFIIKVIGSEVTTFKIMTK